MRQGGVKLTKADLIEKMAKDAEISKTSAGRALNSFIESVMGTVKKNNKVTIVGFGTFSLSKRKARLGRNPQTGEQIKIKASKSPKFTSGKAFKDAVK